MGLTSKQKNWITRNKGKSSINKMSKVLGISKSEIAQFLNPGSNKVISNKRPPKLFYFILGIIPILFFVVLELTLRAFDYGVNTDQWITVHYNKYVTNPNIARRYFYNITNIPETIGDAFDKVKQPNSFRVFVVGGSSAAGYPYMPVGSFSRYIKKRLELVYPDSRIEVVNASISATNTYTIRDLLPGILDQQPDLILIYAGHNEYYGALGVGSNEYLGSSRFIVNTALYLNRFKTFELLRNIVKGIYKLFSSEANVSSSGTLMSKIVKDQYIPYNSDKFNAGIDQFVGNMKDILRMAKDRNVKVILCTVASNLKDQYPFISLKGNKKTDAMEVFKKAKELLVQGEQKEALKEFIIAKELDALRFRAPSEINKAIKELGKEYGDGVVDVDSAFNASSPDGITGNNLMTDHLHPTLEGNLFIGKLFYEEMEKLNLLPKTKKAVSNNITQDSLARVKFDFSKLDSTIAAFEVKSLKNSWPYIDKRKAKPFYKLFIRKNFIDSLASEVVADNVSWENAQGRACQWYLQNNDIDNFKKQASVLISQFPYSVDLYDLTIRSLINLNKVEAAYDFLLRRYRIEPNAYTSKWLGIYELSKNRTDDAINYLEESLRYGSGDAQVLYNLSRAYLNKKEYSKAISAINSCLSTAPNFANAKVLQKQLTNLVKDQN